MPFTILFPIELLLLFFLSKTLTRHISYVIHAITHSKKVTVYTLALLFLPGTFIHELSHYLMAEILFVRAGNMKLFPVIEGDSVKMGSVQIAHTDPIRRFLIGAAPFLFGSSIIFVSIYLGNQYDILHNLFASILLLYVIFEIGNTMFSSKRDMEGALELFVVLLVFVVILYVLGVRPPEFSDQLRTEIEHVMRQACIYVGIPLILDALIIAVLAILKKLL